MPPLIDGFVFGKVTLAGRVYTSDILVFPDGRVQDNWWRLQAHRIEPEDIQLLLDAAPETLIVGTGASGLMRASGRVAVACNQRGIAVEALPTAAAVKRFNEAVRAGGRVAAGIHVGC